MHPTKVMRSRLASLTDLPNIGPAMAADLRLLGYATPESITGADPVEMYERLCRITGTRHDPCVLDVFMSVTDFLNGGEPHAWWQFTGARKQLMRQRDDTSS
jgi:hypothetical protein